MTMAVQSTVAELRRTHRPQAQAYARGNAGSEIPVVPIGVNKTDIVCDMVWVGGTKGKTEKCVGAEPNCMDVRLKECTQHDP